MTVEDPRSPFSRRGFVAAAIVVGVIAVLAVIVVVATLINPAAPSPTTAPTSAPPSGPSAGDESVCGLDGFEETSSLDEAPDNEWELVGTVAAPTDPAVGPGEVDSRGVRTCFAHTAEGALYAIVNYVALGSDARTLPYLADLLAPGPGKDAAEEAAQGEAPGPSTTRAQVAGFKVNSYSPDEAVIDVAWSVTSAGGQLVSFPMVVEWVDGDWKIVLADNGQPPFSSSPLQNLGGYIPWAGI